MKHALLFLCLLLSFKGLTQSKIASPGKLKESLVFNWPESEHWYEDPILQAQTDSNVELHEIVRQSESLAKWTEFGSMMAVNGIVNVPPIVAMKKTFEQAKAYSPNAKLMVIEKDEKAEFPWIIFTIENTASFKSPFVNTESRLGIPDSGPESKLYIIVQGKTALYVNFWAVKTPSLTEPQKEKWTAIFKGGKIVNM
jgi:hypothetical protein